jgi:hypothetical protein
MTLIRTCILSAKMNACGLTGCLEPPGTNMSELFKARAAIIVEESRQLKM